MSTSAQAGSASATSPAAVNPELLLPDQPSSHLPDLETAIEACRRETKRWAKTFYLGTLLMPPAKRRAIWAIYVWCRRTDQLMDSKEAESQPREVLARRLDLWEQRTRRVFKGELFDGPDLALWDCLQNFPQNISPFLDQLEGQRMDLTLLRYPTFEDLKLYCYRVAGTVGLMSQVVMGVDAAFHSAPWSARPDPSDHAVALGIANQLTNILRDVGEDRGRSRIYLPQEDLRRFGYSEQELMAGTVNDNWRALMAFQLERAREWFRCSEQGVRLLSADARWPVWASLRLYRAILSAIERNGYDVFNRRAYVPTPRKLLDLPISFLIAQAR
ncbi:MAG: phytoene synthase [Aphanocapsa feldmannii 277cV]|uniref:Phytoene synthase n=1 Tax=Aphanocapsa feldmannii 277cV TaxID=2507553 RepID=A0A524RP99_9CHRO|nr:MAG: phytoene synthase [Aphanocapsa feldmannii 288cV]TGG92281.1 MAG: phytoene synthase [Aphanocapsa feldmannii 277cV]